MYLEIVPTTTLAQLKANNTSAADSFPGWPNGVVRASAVSHAPLNIPQLALVHRCDWWHGSSHPNIGLDSLSPAYAIDTVADMKARGLGGAFVDWYGPGHDTDKALLNMKPEMERQGLKFSVCVDSGTPSLKSAVTDATRTDALIKVLNYLSSTYTLSPSYLRYNGKPVVLFF
jgi:hypothetical protein